MLFATSVGGIGTLTVSPAWASVGSKSRFTRLPIQGSPSAPGSASAATSFTIAFAKLAEVITAIYFSPVFLSLTNFRPSDTPRLTSVYMLTRALDLEAGVLHAANRLTCHPRDFLPDFVDLFRAHARPDLVQVDRARDVTEPSCARSCPDPP